MTTIIQCVCGAKYALEITPEMAANAPRFVCAQCGADNSSTLSEIIRQEFGEPGVQELPRCPRHRDQVATDECAVCKKPICPACMELFGYVCSTYCKAQAERLQIDVPFYEGQKHVVEARFWKKVKCWAAAVSLVVALIVGLWVWYGFFGSHPKVVFSVRLPESEGGFCKLVTPSDVIVRQGNLLRRYNIKQKSEVWSTPLAHPVKVHWQAPYIWVVYPNKVDHVEWQTGRVAYEIPARGNIERFVPGDGSIMFVSRTDDGGEVATYISLPDGRVRIHEIEPAARKAAATKVVQLPPAPIRAISAHANPDTVGEDIPRLFDSSEGTEFVNAGSHAAQVTVQLLEQKTVQVRTMKDRPVKSALDGEVNPTTAPALVNEMLNEAQQERTGGVRIEDESRYKVTVRRFLLEGRSEWTTEVIGPPHLFPLRTVDVLAASKSLIVLDKQNRKKWEAKLTFPLDADREFLRDQSGSEHSADDAPCQERDGTLYVFDPGVLTAFEVASGNVRWRLPSVGISRLQSGADGFLYVTTTTADPEQIKYSEHIDVTRKILPIIMKVDPNHGKVVWALKQTADSCLFSGKYFFAYQTSHGDGGRIPEHTQIYRIHPRDGRELWMYLDKHFAEDIDFRENTIALLFADELKVLKFL